MIRECKKCGQKNRIPTRHLAHIGKCGQCHTSLPPLAIPLDTEPQLFREVVKSSHVPVLVDFWAEWCGPCKMAAPEVKKAAAELAGKAVVLKVDTQKHPELAQEFGVSGIPNFIVLKAGRVVHQQAGLVNHKKMMQWVDNAT